MTGIPLRIVETPAEGAGWGDIQPGEANERFGSRPRNPLGMGRTFAGGGDATPEWPGGPS